MLANGGQFIYNAGASVQDTFVPTGVWYHVAFVVSGSVGYVYKNGTLPASNTTGAPTFVSSGSSYIGGQSVASGFVNAALDEIKIYN
jgi:hypothetical protein